MKPPLWREEVIAKSHHRHAFDCGDAEVNDFLRRYARLSHEQSASKTFCAIDIETPSRVIGFYTITTSAVASDMEYMATAQERAQHDIRGFKLARIATDRAVAGRGLGGQLLAAAALRCLRIASPLYSPGFGWRRVLS